MNEEPPPATPPSPSLPARWRKLERADRWLLIEALILLVCSRLMILLLPFRRVVRLGADGAATDTPPSPHDLARLRWAIRAIARRMPFRALCFEQGLTARLMLRRRGIGSTLYYGAVREAGGQLATHVWIRCASVDVIGTEDCDRYAILATFPPSPAP